MKNLVGWGDIYAVLCCNHDQMIFSKGKNVQVTLALSILKVRKVYNSPPPSKDSDLPPLEGLGLDSDLGTKNLTSSWNLCM